MPVYAVTGASGHLGRFAVQHLLARGVRTRGKAADLAARGVRVREADYSCPQTLGSALAGADRLLLVSGNEPGQRVVHHTNVIGAARMAGVSRIALTSMLNADRTTGPVADDYRDSERALREAGVPFTLLRNGLYMERYRSPEPVPRSRRDHWRRRQRQDLGGFAPGLRRGVAP